MPRYLISPQTKPQGFQSIDDITHFLTKSTDKEWDPFRTIAHQYLNQSKTPPRRLKKTALYSIITKKPHHLLPELHHEIQQHYDQEDIGGGIIEALHTIGFEVGHLAGLDWLGQVLGIVPRHNVPQTLHSELMAYLVHETYQPSNKRKDHTVGYTRLEKYDNSKFAVYQNDKSQELVVCVRGTKLKMSDALADVKILLGGEPESQQLDRMLDQLEKDFPDTKYDVAAHSLGAFYVYSEFAEHRDNMDEIFFYNPASSPLQNTDMLKKYGNARGVFYHIHQSDIVSHGLYQQMNSETFDSQVVLGPYVYSPISAHSLDQWYAGDIDASDDLEAPGPDYDNQEVTVDTAEYGLDTPETQAAGLS